MNNYIPRILEVTLEKYLRAFPVVGLTGPRQSGKSTLLKHLLKDKYTYITFDDFKLIALLQDDPEKFMRIYDNRVIFDEVHKAPEIFNLLKIAVDNDRDNYGKYIITGSAQFSFLKGVSESLAGRIGLLSLLPFQFSEIPGKQKKMSIFKGGYPELVIRNYEFYNEWFSSYLDTYLNKDLRSISNIGDLRYFRNLMQILAGRCSQILNMSEIARDIGVTVATVKKWISVLEASYIVFLLPPFYKNFGKRIIKAPKLYFYDTGLVSYLLGIENQTLFENGASFGPLFENYIVSEIMKKEIHAKNNTGLFYFRSNYGLEVDLIIDRKTTKDWIEIKASETFRLQMTAAIESLMEPGDKGFLVYNGKELKYTKEVKILNFKDYFSL